MAKVRAALKDKLAIMATSIHKGDAQGARTGHEKIVEATVEQLGKYMPISQGVVARQFKTGEAISEDVVRAFATNDPDW